MKQIAKFWIALSVSAVLLPGTIHGQNNLFTNVIPPPPESASLGKFANSQVNLSTGIPQINIPLWNISAGDFQLPVSLSYHAGGATVTETPSWVGLNWALNAGGIITRTVSNKPDEAINSYFFGSAKIPVAPDTRDNSYYLGGLTDTEPDVFYFNAGNLSGKFVFDQDGNVHTIPYQKIKITPSGTMSFSTFTITGEDGMRYEFDASESSASSASVANYLSTWYLTKIKFPNSANEINFYYTSNSTSFQVPLSETLVEQGSSPPTRTISYSYTTGTRMVSTITYPGGMVNFIKGAYRADFTGGQVLDQVVVSNNNGPVKSYKLNYKYFGSGGLNDLAGYPATSTTPANTGLRLCLNNIQEYDKNGTAAKPPYRFDYESSVWLPDRLNSFAQDHWGYYNGEDGNTTLIPYHLTQSTGEIFNGGLRWPNEKYAKAGSLVKITYPTGGYTTFQYEQNEVAPGFPAPANQVKAGGEAIVGNSHITGQNTIFTVPGVTTLSCKASLTGAVTGSSINPSDQNTYIYFNVFDITNPSSPVFKFCLVAGGNNVNLSNTYSLAPGVYKITITKGGTYNSQVTTSDVGFYDMFYFSVYGIQEVDGIKKVGGLRIKKMTDYDPLTNKSMVKSYEYLDDAGFSSGTTNYVPVYNYQTVTGNYAAGTLILHYCWTSFSQAPLTQTIGATVGYTKVTEYQDDISIAGGVGVHGKTEHYFSASTDQNYASTYAGLNGQGGIWNSLILGTTGPYVANSFTPSNSSVSVGSGPYSGNEYPFAPAISQDWRRGALLKQVHHAYRNGQYAKQKEIINTYKDDYLGDNNYVNLSYDVVGAKICIYSYGVQQGLTDSYNMGSIKYYYFPSRYYKLVNTVENTYDQSGTTILVSQVEDYSYDNPAHLQLTRKVSHESNSLLTTVHTLYPPDYTNTTGFIGDMKNANIIDKPVETATYIAKADGSGLSILGASLTTYKGGSQAGLPDKVWQAETRTPIPKAGFRFSNQAGTNSLPTEGAATGFSLSALDASYPAEADNSFSFDSYGNVTDVNKKKDIPASYLWGYNGTLPIAKALNTPSWNVFYTGFEDATGTADNASHTGRQCLNSGSYTLTASFPATITGSLKMSYWYWNNAQSQWVFSGEQNYTSSITSPGTKLDDIRVYPPGSQMLTYTYEPLLGMTSATNENNVVTYYEYDTFGRVTTIKDYQGNILKYYTYHYAGY